MKREEGKGKNGKDETLKLRYHDTRANGSAELNEICFENESLASLLAGLSACS